jgi:hypothetical protein
MFAIAALTAPLSTAMQRAAIAEDAQAAELRTAIA